MKRLTTSRPTMMIMEFEQTVLKRRMVRHFSREPVSAEALNRILELAQHAPSAGFSQGSAFVVVTESKTKQEIATLQGEAEYSAAGFHKWISEAPIDIVACVSEKIYHERYNEPDKLDEGEEIAWPAPYWFFDIGAGCMLVLLAAVDAGLAAAFSGVLNPPGIRHLLGIPADFHPVGVISIGHGAKDKPSPSLKRGRKPAEQVIHREKW